MRATGRLKPYFTCFRVQEQVNTWPSVGIKRLVIIDRQKQEQRLNGGKKKNGSTLKPENRAEPGKTITTRTADRRKSELCNTSITGRKT